MDGQQVNQTVVFFGELSGEFASRGTVAALVGGKIFEQDVLRSCGHRLELGCRGFTIVIDGEGNDGVLDLVTTDDEKGACSQKGSEPCKDVDHQKLLVKVISKPLDAGTARQTPPMQKIPSRRFP